MVISHGYVSLPEGKTRQYTSMVWDGKLLRIFTETSDAPVGLTQRCGGSQEGPHTWWHPTGSWPGSWISIGTLEVIGSDWKWGMSQNWKAEFKISHNRILESEKSPSFSWKMRLPSYLGASPILRIFEAAYASLNHACPSEEFWGTPAMEIGKQLMKRVRNHWCKYLGYLGWAQSYNQRLSLFF